MTRKYISLVPISTTPSSKDYENLILLKVFTATSYYLPYEPSSVTFVTDLFSF